MPRRSGVSPAAVPRARGGGARCRSAARRTIPRCRDSRTSTRRGTTGGHPPPSTRCNDSARPRRRNRRSAVSGRLASNDAPRSAASPHHAESTRCISPAVVVTTPGEVPSPMIAVSPVPVRIKPSVPEPGIIEAPWIAASVPRSPPTEPDSSAVHRVAVRIARVVDELPSCRIIIAGLRAVGRCRVGCSGLRVVIFPSLPS